MDLQFNQNLLQLERGTANRTYNTMAKKGKKTKEEPQEGKPFEFISAKIRDGFCDYKYKILIGPGKGNVHSVVGEGIIDNDLAKAFSKFNAHLAYSDEVFRTAGIEVNNTEEIENNDLTDKYNVTGFIIKGKKENESIILIGTKHSMVLGDHLEMKTSKINITGHTIYQWYNELKEAADLVRFEVEQYHNGKCTYPEEGESIDANQLTIESHEAVGDMDLDSARL